jgi:probable HAF family extracellular repeat protein
MSRTGHEGGIDPFGRRHETGGPTWVPFKENSAALTRGGRMRGRIVSSVITIELFITLIWSIPVRAQKANGNEPHHHPYKLVDLGTLGGPVSSVDCCDGTQPVLNNQGAAVGGADTASPNPNQATSCPLLPPDPFINVGVAWLHGKPMNLGALPGGYNSFANSIDARGAIVGSAETAEIDPVLGTVSCHPTLWRDGAAFDLGTLGGYEGQALQSNGRGQTVGVATNGVPDSFQGLQGNGFPSLFNYGTQQRAFLWQDGVMTDLKTLGGPDAVAAYVNDRGQVAGASYTDSTVNPGTGIPTEHPFLWEQGAMQDLGSLGGSVAFPNALNNRGAVVGESLLSGDSTEHPFLWTRHEGMQDLGTLGGSFGRAYAINDSGQIVGVATQQNGAIRAFFWQDGVMRNLGTVKGDGCSSAYAMNAKGQVIGASFAIGVSTACDFSVVHTFLWDDNRMIGLDQFVPPASCISLTDPSSINDRGEIVIDGTLNGNLHAFMLVPCGENHAGVEGCIDASEETNAATQDIRSLAIQPSTFATESAPASQVLDSVHTRFGSRRQLRSFATNTDR